MWSTAAAYDEWVSSLVSLVAVAQHLLRTEGFPLTRTSEIVFAQQIAVLEISDNLIEEAVQAQPYMLARIQHGGQLTLSKNFFLNLKGFDKPELTVVLADDLSFHEIKLTIWGDLYATSTGIRELEQHSCVVRLAGPYGNAVIKAVGYVRVTLPAVAESTSD
jgi:hypothetical protein